MSIVLIGLLDKITKIGYFLYFSTRVINVNLITDRLYNFKYYRVYLYYDNDIKTYGGRSNYYFCSNQI